MPPMPREQEEVDKSTKIHLLNLIVHSLGKCFWSSSMYQEFCWTFFIKRLKKKWYLASLQGNGDK